MSRCARSFDIADPLTAWGCEWTSGNVSFVSKVPMLAVIFTIATSHKVPCLDYIINDQVSSSWSRSILALSTCKYS